MKIQKAIPTLLLTVVLGLTLFGCTDTAGPTSSSTNSLTSQSATNSSSNSPASNNAASNPPANGNTASSNANAAKSPTVGSNTANSSDDAVKLTVVKYVLLPAEDGGLTSYYLGIVRNDGSVAAMQLTVHMLDDKGQDAGAPVTMMQYGDLPPGQSFGFNLAYTGDTAIKNPQFKVEGQAVDPVITNLIGKLTVVSQQVGTSPDGYPTVEGEVRNDGDNDVNLWSVNVVAYDAGGNLVDVAEGSPTGDSKFPAHSVAKYHAMLSTRAAKATRFDVIASGEQD